MTETVIKIENLSKQYRLGQIGTGTISHDLNKWWYKIRGKEDPYLKIGETNERDKKSDSKYVWALRDINFNVGKGESLGIIGNNGAGKSTLLKILSRVTGPTTGSFKVKGRIASLLEVGTGFHPELTGRENIYMNGAILGMTKHEIKNKFDEIVAFSGIERYIDTPAKRYSSGMYVRLAFAVAAHLDSEILIADEVLAVGDVEFQKKCLGKMKDVTTIGKTVIFVSHSMPAVRSLCSNAILMQNGTVKLSGPTDMVITKYMTSDSGTYSSVKIFDPPIQLPSNNRIYSFSVSEPGKPAGESIPINSAIEIKIDLEINENELNNRYDIGLHIKDDEGVVQFITRTGEFENPVLKRGRQTVTCFIPANFFNTGIIYLNFAFVENRRTVVYKDNDIVKVVLIDSGAAIRNRPPGFLKPSFEWKSSINM